MLTTPFNTVPPECKDCKKAEVCPHMPAQKSECSRESKPEKHPREVVKKVVKKHRQKKLIKRMQKTGNLSLLTRTIKRGSDGKVISDTITNHIDGTTRNTPKRKKKE